MVELVNFIYNAFVVFAFLIAIVTQIYKNNPEVLGINEQEATYASSLWYTIGFASLSVYILLSGHILSAFLYALVAYMIYIITGGYRIQKNERYTIYHVQAYISNFPYSKLFKIILDRLRNSI